MQNTSGERRHGPDGKGRPRQQRQRDGQDATEEPESGEPAHTHTHTRTHRPDERKGEGTAQDRGQRTDKHTNPAAQGTPTEAQRKTARRQLQPIAWRPASRATDDSGHRTGGGRQGQRATAATKPPDQAGRGGEPRGRHSRATGRAGWRTGAPGRGRVPHGGGPGRGVRPSMHGRRGAAARPCAVRRAREGRGLKETAIVPRTAAQQARTRREVRTWTLMAPLPPRERAGPPTAETNLPRRPDGSGVGRGAAPSAGDGGRRRARGGRWFNEAAFARGSAAQKAKIRREA